MSTGAKIFGMITFVLVSDILLALYLRSVADRVESGEIVKANFDPANARKVATLLLLTVPLIWLVMTLISFGVIPTGIDPIKF